MNSLAAHLLDQLAQMPAASRYRVAYSGGCDSHVLLHALAGVREQLAAPLAAIHINHRLSEQAGAWAEHCRRICTALDIPLVEVTVHAHPGLGESPEAAAREARYSAWRELLQAGEGLLLAQHQDDQAETLLLQLLRGSGPKGLAAMPPMTDFAAGWLGRPLLGQSRAALCRYAREQALDWIEDPSNLDTDLDRNYLRHELLPVLQARWPSAALTLSRAADGQRACKTGSRVKRANCWMSWRRRITHTARASAPTACAWARCRPSARPASATCCVTGWPACVNCRCRTASI